LVKYIINRILTMIPMLIGISIISYLIMNAAPGDAAMMYINPEMAKQDPDYLNRVREKLGLDQPIYIRYAKWFVEVTKGNFGYSYISQTPVMEEIKARIGPTIVLTFSSMLVSIIVGISIGVYCAKRQYKLPDYILSVFAFFGMSLPSFWFAMMLILLFTLKLGWLPSVGLETVGLSGPWYVLFFDRVKHMIMPVLSLSLSGMGSWMRYQRASYLEVMNQDYIRTARSKGLSEKTITWRHAFKNSTIPIITMLGGTLPYLIGGAFVIESVFGLPGMGRYGTQSVFARDYPVVMAVTFFSSILVMAGILLSDLLYVVVDPRIKIN